MSTDNPLVEPADTFYNTPEVTEPNAPTETEEATVLAEPEVNPEIVSEESNADNETKDALYVEIDGEEHNLDDVKKWRDGHLMQSDYTKKTQALAEERKTFEAERDSDRENVLKSKSEVDDMRDTLAVLVAEDDEVDWAELKEDDPERYIELKEKADKRKEALAKVKAERETPADDPALIAEERGKLFAANPEWFDDDGKPTEVYSKETTLMNEYAVKAGFTADEFSQMTRAHYMTTILKAAKYDQLQEKGKKIKETREKVPVVTKPKATKATESLKPAHEVFYGKEASG